MQWIFQRVNNSIFFTENLFKFLYILTEFSDWEDGIWTAGTDLGSEDNFVWITTGKRIEGNDIFWIKSSNLIDNFEDEDCLSLQRNDDYDFVFNDCTCTDSIYFMCEKIVCRTVSNLSHDSPVKCAECQ